jgi:outer membrane protein
MQTLRNITLAVLALAACGLAAAQNTPRWTFSAGGLYVQPNSDAGPLEGGPATPSPASAKVKDAGTVSFGATYWATPQIGIELSLGIPPKHKIVGEGFIAPFGQIASVKQVAPTAFVNWRFDELMPGLRPFVGVGINYTKFDSGKTTASGNAAAGGPTTTEFKDSWGLALHGGMIYEIDKQWSVRGSIGTAQVDTVATLNTTTSSGVISRRAEVDFKPVVLGLSVGYSF